MQDFDRGYRLGRELEGGNPVRWLVAILGIVAALFGAGCQPLEQVRGAGTTGLAALIRAECALSPELRAANYHALIGQFGHPVVAPLDCDGDGLPDFAVMHVAPAAAPMMAPVEPEQLDDEAFERLFNTLPEGRRGLGIGG